MNHLKYLDYLKHFNHLQYLDNVQHVFLYNM
jgi:hypothetical protein